MALELPCYFLGSHLPDAHGPRTARGQELAVRTEGQLAKVLVLDIDLMQQLSGSRSQHHEPCQAGPRATPAEACKTILRHRERNTVSIGRDRHGIDAFDLPGTTIFSLGLLEHLVPPQAPRGSLLAGLDVSH